MAEGQVFYRKRLYPMEEGLSVVTEKWVSIHETHWFDFCVSEHNLSFLQCIKRKDETSFQCARRLKYLKKVAKNCSRFAFETEEEALENLRFLKRRQHIHLTRELKFIKAFLAAETLIPRNEMEVVPESQDLVCSLVNFD